MSNANVIILTASNTFQDWLTQTNDLANLVNGLLNGLFYGDGGNLTLPTGNLIAKSLFISTNGTITQNLTAGGAQITGNLSANNISNVGNLYVTFATDVFTINASSYINTASNVYAGNVVASQNIYTGNLSISNALSVTGNITAANLTALQNIVASNGTFTANLTTEDLTVLGTLGVTQIAVVALSVTDNIANTGNILVTQNVITGNAQVTQNIITGNIFVRQNTSTGNISVTQNVSAGNLSISTNGHFANVITTNVITTNVITGNDIVSQNVYAGNLVSDFFTSVPGTLQYRWNDHGGLTYGSAYIVGVVNGYVGLAIDDGTINPTLMSSGGAAGIYMQGEGEWMILWEPSTITLPYTTTIQGDLTIVDSLVVDGAIISPTISNPSLTGTPTAPTAPVGTHTTQIATTAFVSAAADPGSSIGTNGYQKFASGLIIQWGQTAFDGSNFSVVFPIAFPSACFSAQISQPADVSYGYALPINSLSRTGMSGTTPGQAGTLYWMAVGH